jgi:CBS domain containing-hemolysin-like protein
MDDYYSSFLLFFAESGAVVTEMPTFLNATFNILLVIILVLANGFFVASEFALVAVRKSRIEALASEGSSAAKRLLDCLNNLNAYISATQLGITLFSLGLGWVGEPAIASMLDPILFRLGEATGWGFLASPTLLHTVSFIIAFTIITFLHIAFGELAPKTAALEVSEKVALIVALPLQIFYKTFYYPIRLLDWTGTKIVRVFGLQPSHEHGSIYTEDEIRQLISVSQKSGHLNEEEEMLINKVFEFSDTTVKEAMIPRTEIVAIPYSSTLEDIAKSFRQYGYSRMPVYGESLDDIKGVLHSKDVMQYFLVKSRLFKLDKVLKPPFYVVDTAKLEEVLRQMQKGKSHFGFVVDEHGGVEGIITLEDLLEEIVGDISDEHDEEVSEQIKEQPDGSFILDGNLVVRDLNRRLNINLPISEAYTTVAGFLMSESGQILTEGETVRFNGHIFKVEEVDKRRILKVRMEKS